MKNNKKIVLVTGSDGLVGSESVRYFSHKGFKVVGIDNNSRKKFRRKCLLSNLHIHGFW